MNQPRIVIGKPYTRIATGGVVFKDGDINKVLVVSSLKGPYLVLPKGGLEEGLTYAQNAEKEFLEEAGVVVEAKECCFDKIVEYPDGRIQREIYFICDMIEKKDDWDESGQRKRGYAELWQLSGVQNKVCELAHATVRKDIDAVVDEIRNWELNAGESFTDYFLDNHVGDQEWIAHLRRNGLIEHAQYLEDELKERAYLDQQERFEPHITAHEEEGGNWSEEVYRLDVRLWASYIIANEKLFEEFTDFLEDN